MSRDSQRLLRGQHSAPPGSASTLEARRTCERKSLVRHGSGDQEKGRSTMGALRADSFPLGRQKRNA